MEPQTRRVPLERGNLPKRLDASNGQGVLKGNLSSGGVDGLDAQDGQDGVDGQDGKDGCSGVDGTDAQDGQDGVDGKDADPTIIIAATVTSIQGESLSVSEAQLLSPEGLDFSSAFPQPDTISNPAGFSVSPNDRISAIFNGQLFVMLSATGAGGGSPLALVRLTSTLTQNSSRTASASAQRIGSPTEMTVKASILNPGTSLSSGRWAWVTFYNNEWEVVSANCPQ